MKGTRLLALVIALAVLTMAACGGDDAGGPATDTEASAEPADRDTTTSTERATTTTRPQTTTAEPEPATAVLSGPPAPLTGAPSDDGADLDRPAMVLKIDNHADARPPVGLEHADLVFDVRAEGVTRFAAVFHSSIPVTVGPIRSSRTSDYDLLLGLDHPIYGSSGGNEGVMAGLGDLPIYELTNQTRGEYFRDRSRPAPHNLFIHPEDLYALVPAGEGGPRPWFSYRAAGEEPPGSASPVDGTVTVSFTGGPTVGFSWDATAGRWLRTQNGQPHLTADGEQLAPANVVIMVTTYGTSPADASSPEVRSTGQGELTVLTGGHAITGTWERLEATDKPTLLDEAGDPIALAPGQTWVLYPQAGQVRL